MAVLPGRSPVHFDPGMHPVLFKAFGLTVHSYGVMLVAGFLLAIWLAKKRAKRFGLQPNQIIDAGFWALPLGIVGARLFFVAQDLPRYLKEPGLIIGEGFQGLTSFGGVAFGVLGLYIWSRIAKKPATSIYDAAAAPFLLAHPIGRIGCLLNGCCHGGSCDLPWGIQVQGLAGLYHPAQIYDGLLNLAGLAALLLWERRGSRGPGQSAGFALIAHGVARFIYEFWRAGVTSTTIGALPFTEGHVAALVVVLAGAIMMLWGSSKRRVTT